jgi:hypothetical protein
VSLLVGAWIATGPAIRWQGILDAPRTISLRCLGAGVFVLDVRQGEYDSLLVRDAVDDLSRRLAGYVRTEFRAIQNPAPPPAEPAPGRP